jgi:Cu2+-exporting ATPase
MDAGLGRYYQHRAEFDAENKPADAPERSYAALDDPACLTQFATHLKDGSAHADFVLENLHCAACVWLVERLDRVVPGVLAAEVRLTERSVRVRFDAAGASLGDLARGLSQLGYPPHLSMQTDAGRLRTREDRALLTRIGVAGACAGNVMLIAFALYSGADEQWARLFRVAALLISVPAVFWAGASFFQGALSSLRVRAPHMDLPVSLGLFAGFASGAVNTLRGQGEIYFDSVTAIVFLLLVGRYVERRQHHAAEGAREHVSALFPKEARVIEDGTEISRPIQAVRAGACLAVQPGEAFPSDGAIETGHSSVDMSPLTGEALPVDVGPGSAVFAGTINCSAALTLRATAVGSETRLGRLLEDLRHASSRRAPIQRLADRVAGRFVFGVVALALITFAFWAPLDPTRGLSSAIALLIVTCPCALGLATPLAMSAALGNAARMGLLIRNGETLERLAAPALLLFDKTGTLTDGKLVRVDVLGDATQLPIAAAIAAGSKHPVARAVAEGVTVPAGVEPLRAHPGQGLVAKCDGVEVALGKLDFLQARGAQISTELLASARQRQSEGFSCSFLSRGAEIVAAIVLADRVRDEAQAVLAQLHGRGHRLAIVSGDHEATVKNVARRLALPFSFVRGDALPDEKAQIASRREHGPVVMIGDGVNDSAALSSAGVGIAVHGGAEASLAAADVYVTAPGLHLLPQLFAGAERTLQVVRRNLRLSLAYNVVCAVLAVSGHISPLLAAVLMPLSSLSVVVSSYRARTFEP